MRRGRQVLTRVFDPVHRVYLASPAWCKNALRAAAPAGLRSLVREHLVPLLRGGASAPAGRHGVAVFGYLRSAFGLGEVARATVRSCQAAGIAVELGELPVANKAVHLEPGLDPLFRQWPEQPVQIFCWTAESALAAPAAMRRAAWPGKYRIGIWFWELAQFPREWSGAFDEFDEIWATSPFIHETLAKVSPIPVVQMPLAVDFELTRPYTRADFDLPENKFLCLFSYDFDSYAQRKNPQACIAAFRLAFPPGREDVALVIKTILGARHAQQWQQLQDLARGDPRVILRDVALSRDQFYGLQSVCDVYLSLHRSEGFGFGMAEAMRLSKPVVATGYSGNRAFMTSSNSCLVDYRLVPVADGDYPNAAGQQWAEPDLGQAAQYLRRLHAEPAWRARLGARAAAAIRERHSHVAVGRQIKRRLEQIRKLRA